MRKTTKLGAALAVIGALALSACGGSSALMDSAEGTRTKNAALDSEQGLNVKIFKMNMAGIDTSKYDNVGTGVEKDVKPEEGKNTPCETKRTTVPNIDNASLQEIFTECNKSQLMLHYTGFITIPGTPGEQTTVKFTAVKDDGFTLKIGGKSVIDQWNISSCQEREGTIELTAGKKYPVDAWYFNYSEDGCVQLQWTVGANAKEIVPTSAFTTNGKGADKGADKEDGSAEDTSDTPSTLTDGLVGFWPFDNEATFTASDQGANLKATNGAAYTATGKSKGGLALNGKNQYLDGPTGTVVGLPVGTSNYTISTWFNASALGPRGMVGWGQWGTTNKTNALRLLNNAGGFRHYWWSNDLDLSQKFETGTWYHVVASFDGTTRKLYLNGKEVVKNTPKAEVHASVDKNFAIGRTNGGEYFSGILDEVGIWNRALTDAEIAELSSAEGAAGKMSITTSSTSTTSTTVAESSTSSSSSSSSSTTSTTAVVVSSSSTMAPPSSSSEAPVKVTSYNVDEENTMLVEGDETYNPANNKTFKAPKGKKFGKVLWASYGTPTVENKVLTLSKCHSTKSIDVVQAAAAGKTSFVLPAGNGDYGDPCFGTYKRVKALITLVDDPDYNAATDPNPGVAIDAPGTMYIETPEHYGKTVTAPEGKMFGKVLFASYGIQELSGNKVFYGWCHSKTSMAVVEDALVGKSSGTVPASNGNYGDPCYGTYKHMRVVVTIVDDPSYKKPETPTTTAAPKVIAAPTNLKVEPGNGSAVITWDASAKGDTAVTSYMVQFTSTDDFTGATTLNVISPEALALGLANGQEHQFRVAGVNKAEGVISEWSTVVKATPVAPATTTTTTTEPEATAKVQTVTPVITPTEKSVTIASATSTIDCDKACFDAVVASLGGDGNSPVYVSVDGGERIRLDGSEFTKIPVGKSGQKLTFMTVADDVLQQVSVPVKRAGEAPASTTGSGSDDSSSNMVWILLLLIAIVLGGGGYAVSKKRGNNG